jgi:hypothetical protein
MARQQQSRKFCGFDQFVRFVVIIFQRLDIQQFKQLNLQQLD